MLLLNRGILALRLVPLRESSHCARLHFYPKDVAGKITRATDGIEAKEQVSRNYIHEYFARHSSFDFDPTKCFMKEFRRLAKDVKWKGKRRVKERMELGVAMVHQFNAIWGQDPENLASWQNLCSALGISPPSTIEKCRKTIASLHVNMVDFIDRDNPEQPVERFKNEKELSAYTMRTGRYYHRKLVHDGTLLKCLLRHILNPEASKSRKGRPGKSTSSKTRSGKGDA
ncbi:hypothetical protein BD311DRAFT_755085 [Dichomitus squalens]|uniref:Uncharacterized protein n=1 Tax=Dichomitus squalens TaxID=114155 RepID=A0A4V2K0U2_9APHY|nr:hypothetical protein BD311DRAFT_755085 [Dichomitus squalens]